ncbi:MAG: hypothetical protein O3C60_12915 [Planctomycetota bacterium]|nr:hypothetical protein [Planctomycetota bacterium]
MFFVRMGHNNENSVRSCHQAGIAICIANPRQVRDFAKGHGFLEKSDTIDAFMIRRFAKDVEIHLTAPRTPQQRAHQAGLIKS